MTPYETTIAGLEAGAASTRIELDNGMIKVFHGDDGTLLLELSGVKDGTWNALWRLLEASGKIKYKVRERS